MNSAFGRSTAPQVLPNRRLPLGVGLLLAAALIVLVVVARVEPAGQFFFPRCWLYQTTGLQCPGCGATRALHALLNGEVQRAMQFNALVVLALPGLAWWALRGARGWWTGRWWADPLRHPVVLSTLGGLVVGFGLGRNFP